MLLIMLPFALVPAMIGAALLLRDLRFKSKALHRSGTVVGHLPYLHWAVPLGTSRELVAAYRNGGGLEPRARTGIRLATKKMADTRVGGKVLLLVVPGNPPRVMAEKRLYRSGFLMLAMGIVSVAITLLILW